MKYSQFYRELKSAGCYIVRNGGSHDIWHSPKTMKEYPLPRHPGKEVPLRILKGARKVLLGL